MAQSVEISREYLRGKVRRTESGDSWLTLLFSRDNALFFSWDPEFYGCCAARPDEIRVLSELSLSRPPVRSAVKSRLVGAELTGARTLNRDRVLRIDFRRALGAGIYQICRLLFEASGRYSNLMLLDEEDGVIEAAKHVYPEANRYRSVIPGRPYVPPPPFEGTPAEDFTGDFSMLDGVAGIGRPLIDAIKRRRSGGGNVSLAYLGTAAAEPAVLQRIGSYVTLFPELLDGASLINTGSALEAARECVILPLLGRHTERVRKKTGAMLAQLVRSNDRKIAEAEALLGDESEVLLLMRRGRLILANSASIAPRLGEVELSEWTEDGEVTHKIALDPKKDASQNAERYFARYKKKRAAAERAKKILPRLRLEREELREQSALLECSGDALTMSMMMNELSPAARNTSAGRGRAAKTPPPHRRFDLEDAAAIFVGLSAKGNHYVTFRLALGDDIWLHAQGVPGAHVILRFKSRPDAGTRERLIEAAAAAAARHSKAHESGRVRVDYTERKHVRAITGGGLAQVTYKEFSTVTADTGAWAEFVSAYKTREAIHEAPGENFSDRRGGIL
jgi:predicted ribosome quality control (RQC) complex YloA/Tae2 family protein